MTWYLVKHTDFTLTPALHDCQIRLSTSYNTSCSKKCTSP